MDQTTLLTVMAVFVFVAAMAMVVQAGFLYGIYKASRSMNESVQTLVPEAEALLPKAHALIEASQQTLQESRVQIAGITAKTSDILATTHRQVQRIDSLLEDAASRARIHMDRADLVIDDVMGKAHQTVNIVHGGIIKPLQQIQGVAAGLRTAMQFLTRGRPVSSDANIHADEEMFI